MLISFTLKSYEPSKGLPAVSREIAEKQRCVGRRRFGVPLGIEMPLHNCGIEGTGPLRHYQCCDAIADLLQVTMGMAKPHFADIARDSLLERALKKQRLERRIALSVPSYLGVGLIVDKTDLLVIVPKRLADILARENDVRIVSCTVKLPSYRVKQHWHERYVSDLANMWLRSTVAQLFSN